MVYKKKPNCEMCLALFVFSHSHPKKKNVKVQYFLLDDFFFNSKSKHFAMHFHSEKGRLQSVLWLWPVDCGSFQQPSIAAGAH